MESCGTESRGDGLGLGSPSGRTEVHILSLNIIARAQAGDEAARSSVVDACERTILWVIRPYLWAVDREDLESVGKVAVLADALPTFDPSAGASFPTWAAYKIRNRVQEEVNRAHMLGKGMGRLLSRIDSARKRLEDNSGRAATIAELAAETGFDRVSVRAALDVQRVEMDDVAANQWKGVSDLAAVYVKKTARQILRDLKLELEDAFPVFRQLLRHRDHDGGFYGELAQAELERRNGWRDGYLRKEKQHLKLRRAKHSSHNLEQPPARCEFCFVEAYLGARGWTVQDLAEAGGER
jgi:DNA-directed RNA polymerase specialized sigma subunit